MQDLKIQKIIDQIIEAAELPGMSEALEKEFRKNIEVEIIKRIGIITLESLDDEGLKKYEELSEKEKQDQSVVQEIIKAHSSDFEKNIKEGLENLIKEVIIASKQ
ncbi:hypothetical protein K8R62_02785 [bacterium]|nr:hypothetical protein [bacterium]